MNDTEPQPGAGNSPEEHGHAHEQVSQPNQQSDARAARPFGAPQHGAEGEQSVVEQQMETLRALSMMSNEELESTLVNASPDQRKQILADVEQYRKMEKKARERVSEATADDGKTADEKRQILDPDMPDEIKQYHRNLEGLLEGNVTDSGGLTNETDIKAGLAASHMSKEDANEFLKGHNVSDGDTLTRVTEDLRSAEAEDNDPQTEKIDPLKEAEVAATGGAVPQVLEQMNIQADESLAELPTDMTTLTEEQQKEVKKDRQKILDNKGKIASLSQKFQDFFSGDESGRKYARIGGKILYFALIAAFIALVFEMNMISRMSKRK